MRNRDMLQALTSGEQKVDRAAPCTLDFPSRFFAAVLFIGSPPEELEIEDEAQLMLQALFQQVTVGPNTTSRPWGIFTTVLEQAKWDAWSHLGKMETAEAMRLYVSTVEGICRVWWQILSECNDEEKVNWIMKEAAEMGDLLKDKEERQRMNEECSRLKREVQQLTHEAEKQMMATNLSAVDMHEMNAMQKLGKTEQLETLFHAALTPLTEFEDVKVIPKMNPDLEPGPDPLYPGKIEDEVSKLEDQLEKMVLDFVGTVPLPRDGLEEKELRPFRDDVGERTKNPVAKHQPYVQGRAFLLGLDKTASAPMLSSRLSDEEKAVLAEAEEDQDCQDEASKTRMKVRVATLEKAVVEAEALAKKESQITNLLESMEKKVRRKAMETMYLACESQHDDYLQRMLLELDASIAEERSQRKQERQRMEVQIETMKRNREEAARKEMELKLIKEQEMLSKVRRQVEEREETRLKTELLSIAQELKDDPVQMFKLVNEMVKDDDEEEVDDAGEAVDDSKATDDEKNTEAAVVEAISRIEVEQPGKKEEEEIEDEEEMDMETSLKHPLIRQLLQQEEEDKRKENETSKLPLQMKDMFAGSWVVRDKATMIKLADINTKDVWTKPEVSGDLPIARHEHGACIADKMMVVMGGRRSGRLMRDVMALDLEELQWRKIETSEMEKGDGMGDSAGHSVMYMNGKILVMGGLEKGAKEGEQFTLKMLDWNTKYWRQPSQAGNVPGARAGFASCRVGSKLWVFGGEDKNRGVLGDAYYLDTETMMWHKPHIKFGKGLVKAWAKAPPPLAYHQAASFNSFIVIFGGMDEEGICSGELFVLDTAKMQWTAPIVAGEPPFPRAGHSGAVLGSRWYVVGGGDGAKAATSTHCLELSRVAEGLLKWEMVTDVGQKPVQLWKQKDSSAYEFEVTDSPYTANRNPLSSEGLTCVAVPSLRGGSILAFGGSDGNFYNDLLVLNPLLADSSNTLDAAKAAYVGLELQDWLNLKEKDEYNKRTLSSSFKTTMARKSA